MKNNLILKNGRVIDPAKGYDQVATIVIKDGDLDQLQAECFGVPSSFEVIDCTGLIIVPGLVDMHVHFRTPGFEHKECLGSGSLAALAGGFTTALCMANTKPVTNTVQAFKMQRVLLENYAHIDLYQVAPITSDLAGKEMVDYDQFTEAGAVGFSDDGIGLQDPQIIIQAMRICAELKQPLILHCQDTNYDVYDKRAQYMYVYFVLKLAEQLNCSVHIQHVCTKEEVQMIREAKSRDVKVTAETAPHYLSLTHADFKKIGANAKMNPPLRGPSDRQAIIEGLKDGTIDVIATDHAPHTPQEKAVSVDQAPFGVIGLETAVPVVVSALKNHLPLLDIFKKMTINPVRIMGLEQGQGEINLGMPANLTVIDLKRRKRVVPDSFYSKSRNCPWAGKVLQNWPIMTIRNGRIVMKDGQVQI